MVAVLNVLTGMFVDAAMKVAECDDQEVNEEKNNDAEIEAFRKFVYDTVEYSQDTRTFSKNDLNTIKGLNGFKSFLKFNEIEESDAMRVFKQLSSDRGKDGMGQVSVDDFIIGCGKIQGDGCLDMVTLLSETRKFSNQLGVLMEWFDEIHDTSFVTPLRDRLINAGGGTMHGDGSQDTATLLSEMKRFAGQLGLLMEWSDEMHDTTDVVPLKDRLFNARILPADWAQRAAADAGL